MKQSRKILVNELRGIIYTTDFAKSNFANQGKGLSKEKKQLITEFEKELSELYGKEIDLLEKINLKIEETEDDEKGG